MQNYQLLEWDTKILGVPTARILPARVAIEQLAAILAELKSQHVALVYWAADSHDAHSQLAASECKGFLADKKVTYWLDLHQYALPTFAEERVESYIESSPDSALLNLAFESGNYSRFKMDPRITTDQFHKVYSTWMQNSTNRQIAQAVLVVRQHDKIVAMTTLGEKNKRGDIGLLAVDSDYRGMQLGSLVVYASQAWSIQQGYRYTQVVTQQDNLPACKLYEKCGYTVEKIEHFYHFWL